ncbi:hypothetical protein [Streptomyces sp. NPDC005953]|uniref:hypothetical protein n=1 Tax=unclassified Streptomyces TaxID=2593676 RepID=UPI0033D7C85C
MNGNGISHEQMEDLAETGAREHPYEPRAGDIVRDACCKRVGQVMGHVGPEYRVRPLNGGREWAARVEDLAPARASDAMSADVAQANAMSRWGALT